MQPLPSCCAARAKCSILSKATAPQVRPEPPDPGRILATFERTCLNSTSFSVGTEPNQNVSGRLPAAVEDGIRQTAQSVTDSSWTDSGSNKDSPTGHLGTPQTEFSARTEDGSAVSESGVPSDTTSLPADAQDYVNIGKRLFPNPKYGWGWCAVDAKSLYTSERDLKWRISRQGFYHWRAPIAEVTNVLDLQALSGGWADQVALCHDSARVCGISITPVQSAEQPNCYFEFDNINLEWDREREAFDLIYGQKLLGNMENFHSLLHDTFRCLVGGGFVEFWDRPFMYSSKDGAIDPWSWVSQQVQELGESVGCPFSITPNTYKAGMEAAGFLYVFEEWETIPVAVCLESVFGRH